MLQLLDWARVMLGGVQREVLIGLEDLRLFVVREAVRVRILMLQMLDWVRLDQCQVRVLACVRGLMWRGFCSVLHVSDLIESPFLVPFSLTVSSIIETPVLLVP